MWIKCKVQSAKLFKIVWCFGFWEIWGDEKNEQDEWNNREMMNDERGETRELVKSNEIGSANGTLE